MDEVLQEWLRRADNGDHVAQAYVAIVRYLSDPTLSGSARDEINNWLRKAMTSDDPEFLVSVAEELVFANAIYRDLDLARDFLLRALSLSPLKGSYAMARFTAGTNRRSFIEYLTRAADLGHVPSKRILLAAQKQLTQNRLARSIQTIRNFPGLFLEIRKVFSGTANHEKWWRYKDILRENQWKELAEDLGEDRAKYFAWARPSSVADFSRVLAKGQSVPLLRGEITFDSLRPQTVSDLRISPGAPTNRKKRKRPSRWSLVSLVFVVVYVVWGIHSLVGALDSLSGPIIRNPSTKAIIEVGIQLKDGSILSKTFRPDDFVRDSGDRSIQLSEQSTNPLGASRSVSLTLEHFDGWDGKGLIRVQPHDNDDKTLEVSLPGYEQCADVRAFDGPSAIKICTKELRD